MFPHSPLLVTPQIPLRSPSGILHKVAGIVEATYDSPSFREFNDILSRRVLAKSPEMIQGNFQNPAKDC